MPDRARAPWALALTAFLALLVWGAPLGRAPLPPPGLGGKAATDQGGTPPPASAPDPVDCVLVASLGGPRPEPRRIPPVLEQALDGADRVEGLVALVPHPTLSRLPAVFDAHVQATQRALEDAGYLLDRYWLPWSLPAPGKTHPSLPPPAPCDPRADQSPGVLLFRESWGGGQRLLLVLLVPESPTSGADKALFARALDALAGLERGQAYTARGPSFRVLGPTFSGSVPSLQRVILSWSRGYLETRPSSGVQFEIVSGSLTDRESAVALDRTHDPGLPNLRVSFRTTLHTDEHVQALFFHYLQSRHTLFAGTACPAELPKAPEAILKKVALLVESNTTYGQAVLGNLPATRRDSNGVLKIPFPMHVGQLRAEWSKATSSQAPRSPAPLDIPQPSLDLPTDGTAPGLDVVPPFSNLSSRVDDLILSQVLAVIPRNHIAYVGFVATDVQDRLFLARVVREHCPDVTLFSLGSDLLYTHPQHARDLEGMLVASTYPLFTENQVWAFPHRGLEKRIQFPTSEAEGVFNAALVLLGRTDLMMDYGFPQPREEETRSPYPPVWVSAVGRGRLWPVAALCVKEQPEPSSDPLLHPGPQGGALPVDLGHKITSSTFVKVALGFVLLCLLHTGAYSVIRGRHLAGALGRLFPLPRGLVWQLLPAFARSANGGRDVARQLYVYSSFLILSAIYAWVTVPLVLRLAADWRSFDFGFALELAIASAGWVALLCPMFDIAHGLWRRRAQTRGSRYAVLGLVVPLLPLSLAAATLLYVLSPLEDLFGPVEWAWVASFYLRASNLGSGLSPLLPMLFLGLVGYLWSLCELRRLHLGESAPLYSAAASFAGPGAGDLGLLKDRVDGLLADSRRNFVASIGLLAVLVVLFVASLHLMPPSIDGQFFVGLFEVFLLLSSLAIVFEFVRFGMIWAAFAKMLRRFAWLGLGQAFQRLPPSIASVPVLGLAGPRSGLDILKVSLDTWEALADAWAGRSPGPGEEELAKALGPSLRKARRQLRGLTEADAHRQWRAERTRRALEKTVDRASVAILAALGKVHGGSSGWPPAAQDFAAMAVLRCVHYVFGQLRNLLFFATSATLLVLTAISSYPFQPKQLLLALSWLTILSIAAIAVTVFVQMDRDELLSWLNKTTPGRVGASWELVSRLATHVLLPVLGLMAAQFPEVARLLFFWVPPLQSALR